MRRRDEHFGLAFDGYLEVPEEGAYTFRLAADGPARLFVGGAEVVRLVSRAHKRVASGAVGLKPGRHAIRLLYAHGGGRPSLRLRWAVPGVDEQDVPADRLSRRDPAASAVKAPEVEPGPKSYGLPRREVVTTLEVPADPADLPPLLSQTGVFASLADLTPNPGLVPYRVNTPLWSDGADKGRWMALPGDARVGFSEKGEWKFAEGTVFVKHFEMPTGETRPGAMRRPEARLLVVGRGGRGYGVTYKWREDGRDADLLAEGRTEEFAVRTAIGPRTVRWTYPPSRTDCLLCHTAQAGFVLGVKTRQLNGYFTYPGTGVSDNQLRAWNHVGLFDPPIPEDAVAGLDRLVAVGDASAPAERRVRSYLDANCAHCHRPGGTRTAFDARFDTPLAEQKLINGPLTGADLGVPGGRVVAPGDLAPSVLYQRMNRRGDVFAMPPLASRVCDPEALAATAEWIKGLAAAPK